LTIALTNLRNLLNTRSGTCGSFYIISQGRIHRQWNLWNKYLPTVKPYYAVKCNPETNILRWLGALGSGFDCASAREMELCRQATNTTADPYRIVFANPCKTAQDIETARGARVPWATIDCCEELEKMRDRAYMPELLLRLAVDDAASDTPFSKKFGLDGWDEVKRLYDAANAKGFKVSGFSFHVGSGCRDFSQYQRAIAKVDTFWGKLKGLGAAGLHTIDIGGGFRAGESFFAPAAESIKKGLAELDAAAGANIIAEPGRFFATPSHDLFVRVIGKKPALRGSSGGWRYTIDESVYGQFSCIPFDGQRPPFARITDGSKPTTTTTTTTRPIVPGVVFGRTCDSLDIICYGSQMEELEIGDWLYFPWMGAYTTVTSSEFNGFPKPHVIYSSPDVMPEVAQWPETLAGNLSWQKGIEYALETRSKI
jgi:ornithine decarboxylase